VHHQNCKTVGAGAEEPDVSEWQVARKTVNDVHALGEDQEDHEIEQQEMVLIKAGQHREHGN